MKQDLYFSWMDVVNWFWAQLLMFGVSKPYSLRAHCFLTSTTPGQRLYEVRMPVQLLVWKVTLYVAPQFQRHKGHFRSSLSIQQSGWEGQYLSNFCVASMLWSLSRLPSNLTVTAPAQEVSAPGRVFTFVFVYRYNILVHIYVHF